MPAVSSSDKFKGSGDPTDDGVDREVAREIARIEGDPGSEAAGPVVWTETERAEEDTALDASDERLEEVLQTDDATLTEAERHDLEEGAVGAGPEGTVEDIIAAEEAGGGPLSEPDHAAGDAGGDPLLEPDHAAGDAGDDSLRVPDDAAGDTAEGPARVPDDPFDDHETTTRAEMAAGAPPSVPPPGLGAPAPSGRGGLLPGLIGGAIAAGLGFLAATFLTDPPSQAPLEQAIAAQTDRIGALEARLGEMTAAASEAPSPAGDGGETAARIEGLSEQIGERITALEGKIAAAADGIGRLEQRAQTPLVGAGDGGDGGEASADTGADTGTGTGPDAGAGVDTAANAEAVAAYERELEDLRATLADQQARNEEMSTELATLADAAQSSISDAEARAGTAAEQAAAEAQAAARRAALARLTTELSQGQPFADVLAALEGAVEIPPALAENAEAGVASQRDLYNEFPTMARAALDASIRETVGEDPVNRLGAFLRSQTGARSLAPREGDDPDAILSRAEAALRDADLETALSEIATLPEGGQNAMADWTARAQARVDVLNASATLAETLQAE